MECASQQSRMVEAALVIPADWPLLIRYPAIRPVAGRDQMHSDLLKRREFISLLGGAAVAWPLAARAQQAERMRRIGVLMGRAESDPEGQSSAAAFLRGLAALGWIPGRNLKIDYR